jgi:hypothetical protein
MALLLGSGRYDLAAEQWISPLRAKLPAQAAEPG